jgi:hypothetical protein
MSRWERGAIVLVALAAVATLALGLRIGSTPSVHAAMVFGAPPASDHAGLAWQLVTVLDDRGVREAVELPRVSMLARSKGRQARWDGSTNGDGVAEVWLGLPGVSAGDSVSLEVRTPLEKTPLAEGSALWPADLTSEAAEEPVFARPSRQTGELLIEVAVYGGRLASGFPSTVWVHVRDAVTGQGVVAATIDASSEPGLSVSASRITTNPEGWAELQVTAEIQVVALGLRALGSRGSSKASGEWYGALPVAPGGSFVSMPMTIPPGVPYSFDVLIPTVLPRVYVEIDDAIGRAFAAWLPVERAQAGSHAVFAARPLTPGTYWLVTSGDPQDAAIYETAAIARPFVVRATDEPALASLGPRLATLAPPRFSRFIALDGLPGRHMASGGRRRRGLGLAFGSLLVAAALETMLVLRAVGRSRRELAAVAEVAGEPQAQLEHPLNVASVFIGILVALLGFALLACLLTWNASSAGP